ncbi:hypothetical protein Bca4012_048748 [Brassica carinata]|uniref:Uncharacterized protein n=1 Tax=Brassica carinata TaxID=52824 RepID=A0A8X7R2W5_BRACI|nr:hypothetical protein Bca52824_051642 [Brassica carinata]
MERAIKTTQCRSQYVNPMQHGTKTPTKLALHGSYQILYTLSKLPDRAQCEFPLVAEALVMRAALQAVISLDITHLQMTSDNQTLIRAINDKLFEKESYGLQPTTVNSKSAAQTSPFGRLVKEPGRMLKSHHQHATRQPMPQPDRHLCEKPPEHRHRHPRYARARNR